MTAAKKHKAFHFHIKAAIKHKAIAHHSHEQFCQPLHLIKHIKQSNVNIIHTNNFFRLCT